MVRAAILVIMNGMASLTAVTQMQMQVEVQARQHTPVQALQHRPDSLSPRPLQPPDCSGLKPACLPTCPTLGLTAAATAAVPFWAPVCMKDRMPDTRLFPIWARPLPPACGGRSRRTLRLAGPLVGRLGSSGRLGGVLQLAADSGGLGRGARSAGACFRAEEGALAGRLPLLAGSLA